MATKAENSLKVLIEIPEGSRVKYELNEETGEIFVDRFMPTAMGYPVNYGLIEETSGEDGDALDALVFISEPIVPGVFIKCKMIGVLEMEDEEGIDHKIVCVPANTKIDPTYGALESIDQISEVKKAQIKHFFEHYKDLEKGKFVKLNGWHNLAKAQKIYDAGVKRYEEKVAAEMAEYLAEEEGGCPNCSGACKG